jgi:acyl-CoA synthetase (NDP forming)
VQNPVDLTPIWWEFPKVYPPLVRTLFGSEEIDLLLVTMLDVATTLEELMYALTETVTQTRRDFSPAKPLYVYWASRHSMLKNMRILEAADIPCYQSTLDTTRVVSAICQYATQFTCKRSIAR